MITDFILGTAELIFSKELSPEVFNILSKTETPFTHSKVIDDVCSVRIPFYRLNFVSLPSDVTVKLHGVPHFFYLYKKRWGIAIGAIIAFLIIYFSGTVIWNVNVIGNENISTNYIVSQLEKVGCYEGAVIKDLDFDRVNNKFLINSEGIKWISVNMYGTVANAEVREVTEEFRNVEASEKLCNLTASESGQIVRVSSVEGKPLIKIGDVVKQGDILVSGIITYRENHLRFESATGSVFAKVKRSFDVEVPKIQSVKVYNGRKTEKNTLYFFKNRIKLFINSRNPYSLCDTITMEKPVVIFDKKLPLELSSTVYKEFELENALLNDEELQNKLLLLYRKKLKETLGDGELLQKEISYSKKENGVAVHCELFCIADIAKKSEIDFKKGREEKYGTNDGSNTQ